MTTGMIKAFKSVEGALKRKDLTELKCKKIWLERVIRELNVEEMMEVSRPLLKKVNTAIKGLS